MCQRAIDLQHLRQLWALRAAWIVHVVCNVLWAVGCKFIEPIDHLGIAAPLINEASQSVTAITPALITAHAQHIELNAVQDNAPLTGADDGPIKRCYRRFDGTQPTQVAQAVPTAPILPTTPVVHRAISSGSSSRCAVCA